MTTVTSLGARLSSRHNSERITAESATRPCQREASLRCCSASGTNAITARPSESRLPRGTTAPSTRAPRKKVPLRLWRSRTRTAPRISSKLA